jgi:hypothetical protein
MPPRLPAVLGGAAMALAAAAPVPATALAAPALTALKPCYDAVDKSGGGTEPVIVGGTGFTPNALVDIALDGNPLIKGVHVDGTGTLPAVTIPAPYVSKGRKGFQITVTEQANRAQTVSATSLVTRLTVAVTPRSATPSTTVRFSGEGFTDAAPVYAHYVRKGRLRRTVRLAKATSGACGQFSVKRHQFPFRPAVGKWRLQVDQQKAYAKAPDSPFLVLSVDVRRAG